MSVKPSEKLFHEHFGKKIFWEEKYSTMKGAFEWYQPYKMIKDVVTQYIKDVKGARVLNVGCGMSKLPEDMYNDGFRNIVSIDAAEDCILEQRSRFNETMPKTFLFMKMDCLDMQFGDEIFTTVVDKGTLDSIASGFRSTENIDKYLSEVDRVMTRNGIFFCLSHRDPEDREPFLTKQGWSVFTHKIYRPKFSTELRFIKQKFISKKVLEQIELDKEIELTPKDIVGEDDTTLVEEILERIKAAKEQEIQDKIALKPREVDCFYLYVCLKGKIEEERTSIQENNLISADGGEFSGEKQATKPHIENKDHKSVSGEEELDGDIEEYGHELENGSIDEDAY